VVLPAAREWLRSVGRQRQHGYAGRREAQHLAVERQRGLAGGHEGLAGTEPVPLAGELDQGRCRSASRKTRDWAGGTTLSSSPCSSRTGLERPSTWLIGALAA
jgi:hypothetical protein